MIVTDPLGRPLFAEGAKCQYCGTVHDTVCSKIGRIELDLHGMVTAIEMRAPVPFSLDYQDEENAWSVCGTYEDVKRWEREKMQ